MSFSSGLRGAATGKEEKEKEMKKNGQTQQKRATPIQWTAPIFCPKHKMS